MSRPLVLVAAVGVLGLSILMFLIAQGLLPTMAEAQERGTYAPLIVTWLMVWATIGCGLVLAGYLFVVGLRSGRAPASTVARAR